MMRFTGTTEAKMDAKGRVFLPAGFRKTLQASGEDSVVLRKDVFCACLTVYPMSAWNSELDSLKAKLDRWNKAHRDLLRQFVAEAEPAAIDASGRVLVPKRLQQAVGLNGAARFIGLDDRMELWPADAAQPQLGGEEFSQALERLLGQDRTPQ